MRSSIESQTSLGGGNINLSSLGKILIQDNSLLSVQSDGIGAAGNINLNALGPDGIKLEFSDIRSTVESAGGNVSLVAPNGIVLESGNLIASTLLDGANVVLETQENLDLVNENFISLTSGDGINSGMGGNLSIEALQVLSVRLDTDIKVVGPNGNFQTNITNRTRPFRGFANPTFTNVIRDNGRSEIQITSLPPFPPPSPAPAPIPVLIPPSPPTPIPILIESPIVPVAPVELTPVVTTVLPIPLALPATPAIAPSQSQEETEESDEDGVVWIPSLLPNEEEEALALGNAYRIRRSRCAPKEHLLNQGHLAVTGRGGLPESPRSSLLQSSPLEDLGRFGFSLGSGFSGERWGQARRHAVEMPSRSKLLEVGGWKVSSKGKIQLVAGGRVSAVSAGRPCKVAGKESD